MTHLKEYRHFEGRHWETGSVHNVYAYRGVKAPHSDEPYSEALLLGVSGGIVTGYFTFAYKGYDPQCNILTRNTFDPFETMLSRLGVVQNLVHTSSPQKAETILRETLADGVPAIVWADMWSLPYNALGRDEGMWGSFPVVVYGFDPQADTVWIADRAQVPLRVSVEELAAARSRIKKDKHRLVTLEPPDPGHLAAAVRQGIDDCIKLFTEKPPKGTAKNFGLQAYRFWAEMLRANKDRLSWAKVFPPGVEMFAGLTTAFQFSSLFGKGLEGDAERSTYARFLDEAAVILDKPELREVGEQFLASAALWRTFPEVLLPDDVPPFAEARRLMWERHVAFLTRGNQARDDMLAADVRLRELRQAMADDFPLTGDEAVALKEAVADHLIRIHDAEETAVEALKAVITS